MIRRGKSDLPYLAVELLIPVAKYFIQTAPTVVASPPNMAYDKGRILCACHDDYFLKERLGLTERKDQDSDNPHSGRIVPPQAFDNPICFGWWPLCGTSSTEDEWRKPDCNFCSCFMHNCIPCLQEPLLFALWIVTGFCFCQTLPCTSRIVSSHYVKHYPWWLTSGPAYDDAHRSTETTRPLDASPKSQVLPCASPCAPPCCIPPTQLLPATATVIPEADIIKGGYELPIVYAEPI